MEIGARNGDYTVQHPHVEQRRTTYFYGQCHSVRVSYLNLKCDPYFIITLEFYYDFVQCIFS